MQRLAKYAILSFMISSITLPVFAKNMESQPLLTQGFYAGIGGSANTVDENFQSFFKSTNKSAHDTYTASANRLAPMLQVGYFGPLRDKWLWGVVAQWKYLNYQTANDSGSHGQHLPNPSFSSINFFGPSIERDFSSQTNLNNEMLLLFYLGMQLMQGDGCLGIGPAFITASNHIYVSSVHTPNGVGNNLVSTSVNSNTTLWGGAVQIGYNFFLDGSWFLNMNYTYLQTVNSNFNNSVNAATLNGASVPGPTTLTLNRNINVSTQEIMFSINKMF